MTSVYEHIPVLMGEVSKAFAPSIECLENPVVVDCTLGGGGYTKTLLDTHPNLTVIGIDRDLSALENAQAEYAEFIKSGRLILFHSVFSKFSYIINSLELQGKIAGICADIGVSSMHLDQEHRGFSFKDKTPLDMRMDTSQSLTAAHVLNTYDEKDLVRIFRDYGQEPKAFRIAQSVLYVRKETPFVFAEQFASLCRRAWASAGKSRKNPATRCFQALRIEVNNELGELELLLQQSLDALAPKGRVGIVSFHSLEDRRVKRTYKSWTGEVQTEAEVELHRLPVQGLATAPSHGKIIKPFPQVAGEEELAKNPRARSARLRVFEKQN